MKTEGRHYESQVSIARAWAQTLIVAWPRLHWVDYAYFIHEELELGGHCLKGIMGVAKNISVRVRKKVTLCKVCWKLLINACFGYLLQTQEKVGFTEAILHLFLSLSRIPMVWAPWTLLTDLYTFLVCELREFSGTSRQDAVKRSSGGRRFFHIVNFEAYLEIKDV